MGLALLLSQGLLSNLTQERENCRLKNINFVIQLDYFVNVLLIPVKNCFRQLGKHGGSDMAHAAKLQPDLFQSYRWNSYDSLIQVLGFDNNASLFRAVRVNFFGNPGKPAREREE